jgi:hypothetical protein
MPNVRSIATKYNNVTFRSMLEARWAVFFDAMGIPWEYEPECQFLDGGPYLPDFKLWGSLHVECKPRLSATALWDQFELLLDRVRGMDTLLVLTGWPRVQWYPAITVTPPCTFWLDFERSAAKGHQVWLLGDRCPPLADLASDRTRYERAVELAKNTELLIIEAA